MEELLEATYRLSPIIIKKKEGFNSLFTNKDNKVEKEEKKQKKLHCMIDEELKKELDIYAIRHSMNIKEVVEKAIFQFII